MHLIFDANLPYRLSDGLRCFESGDEKSIISRIDHAAQLLGDGALDPDIIKEAGKTNAIIISQDDDFKRIVSNRQLIRELKVGYLMYRPPKRGSRYWEIIESFILGWEKIKSELGKLEPPFLYQMDKKGHLSRVEL